MDSVRCSSFLPMQRFFFKVIFCFMLLGGVWQFGAFSQGISVANAGYELPLSGKARVELIDHTSPDAKGAVVISKAGELFLSQGMEVVAPCTVSTKDSRLELLMPDGSVLRFDANTEFVLVSAVADTQNRQIEVDVAVGDVWASVSGFLDGDSSFEIATPSAVAGVAGTKYHVAVGSEKESAVMVHEGRVAMRPRWTAGSPFASAQEAASVKIVQPTDVDGPENVPAPTTVDVQTWLRMLNAGMRFDINQAGVFREPYSFDMMKARQDAWVRWNQQRDAKRGL